MDPITHALSGVLLKKASNYEKPGKGLTLFCSMSAMLPDIDILCRLVSEEFYLTHHRGVTHSIPGAAMLCLLFSFSCSKISPIKDFRLLFKLGLVAVAIHLVFDLITSYGTQLLFPFMDGKFALDYVFIIDLSFSSILIVAIFLCYRPSLHTARAARLGFLVLGCYVAACGLSHELAMSSIKNWSKKIPGEKMGVSAIPQPFTLFNWAGIIETEGKYYHTFFNNLAWPEPEWTAFPKSGKSLYIELSENSEIVKKYRRFAKFPVVYYKKEGNYHMNEYLDIRFRTKQTNGRMPFLLRLVYKENGDLVSTKFEAGKPWLYNTHQDSS